MPCLGVAIGAVVGVAKVVEVVLAERVDRELVINERLESCLLGCNGTGAGFKELETPGKVPYVQGSEKQRGMGWVWELREKREVIRHELVHDINEVIDGGLGADNEGIIVCDVGFTGNRNEWGCSVCGAECGGERR